MSLLEGQIDYLGRPIVGIELAGEEPATTLRCLVDTGFNRSLLISRSRAQSLGFRSFDPIVLARIVTGHHRAASAELRFGDIIWFGERRTVDIHVVPWEPGGAAEDAPHALLGTELLRGLHVFLDFQFGRVVIQSPLPARSGVS